MGYALIERHWV